MPPSGEDFDDDRGGWGNKLDFLFSCISVSVGLGSKLLPNLLPHNECFKYEKEFQFWKDYRIRAEREEISIASLNARIHFD